MAEGSAPWTKEEQAALEASLRAYPASPSLSPLERWEAIAASVPGRSAKECVHHTRQIAAALRAALPSALLRIKYDCLCCILECLPPAALCALACTCRELMEAAHADALWLPISKSSLPPSWAYSERDRYGEPPWKYCLRIRFALHGAWQRLLSHRAGGTPFLDEIGVVTSGAFRPHGEHLPCKLTYGAVCELVRLHCADEGKPTAETYKEVASFISDHSPNSKSHHGPLHMTVRQMYKTCYPASGHRGGGGDDDGAAASDEEMRRCLEMTHVFFALVE